MKKPHASVIELSNRYLNSTRMFPREITSVYFCDNEIDANECAKLAVQGEKRATATSMWWFEINQEELPSTIDNYIVTDWMVLHVALLKLKK